ncbi:winged helix-turn-helix transcriptional regulator [Streptomyces lydicus]|uniref:winged helix-turn-helix transcriptional regulator n=1 Tax=Streptomyces lydicus TaxID=47763 RepID=UPI0036971CBF
MVRSTPRTRPPSTAATTAATPTTPPSPTEGDIRPVPHPFTLAIRPARFGELRTAIDRISVKMLAGRLRELLDAGLITHDRLPPGPAAYPLTTDGRALLPALERIRCWSRRRRTT